MTQASGVSAEITVPPVAAVQTAGKVRTPWGECWRRFKKQPVGIDDACMFLAVFKNGSMGTFESTRYARGHKNFNTFELNGEAGSIYFDLEDPQYLQYFKYADPKTGAKIESHLTGGAQKFTPGQDDAKALEYGKSITDACIGWGDSLQVLETLSGAVRARRG